MMQRRNGSAVARLVVIACSLAGLPAAGVAQTRPEAALVAAIPDVPGATSSEAGRARLMISLEDTRLTITLDALASDITGLDHPPADPAETAQLALALKTLRAGETLFLLPAVAWCRPASAAVANPEAGGSPRARLKASWQFQCGAPAALQWVDAHLLAVFPGIRQLETSAALPAGAKSVVLTAGTPRILLPREPLSRR